MSLQDWALKISKLSEADSSHEELLWWHLHFYMLDWWHLDRQYEVDQCHLDIVVKDVKLDIEIDGKHWHRMKGRPEADAKRDKFLESRGWTVLRVDAKFVALTPKGTAKYIKTIVKELRKENGNVRRHR